MGPVGYQDLSKHFFFCLALWLMRAWPLETSVFGDVNHGIIMPFQDLCLYSVTTNQCIKS